MAAQYLSRMEFLHEIFRIVLDHSNFFQDDLLFFFDFFGIETGMMEEIGQQFERLLELLIQHLDVKRRRLACGERIHLAAKRIDFARNFGGGARARAFKEHVLDEMGVAGLGGCSSRDPVLTQMPTVTDLSVGIRSVTTRTPLSSTSLRYKMLTRTSGLWSRHRWEPAWFPYG